MIVSHVDEVPTDYAAALDAADTLEALRRVAKLYGEVAIDAVMIAERMTDDDFDDWRAALKKERKGRFMGEEAMEKFGALLMPAVMFKVSIVANQFNVPWGLAYNQLKAAKRLVVKGGVANVDF